MSNNNVDNNVTGYNGYFRQLAVSHRKLKHDVESETGDCEPGAQKFCIISVVNVLNSLNSKIGFPCLTLELYETETESEITYDIRQKPRGAFMVVDYPESDSTADQENFYITTERIIYQILKQIWKHHYDSDVDRCDTPFKEFDFNKITITPVGPIFSRCYGWRVEFNFEFQNYIDLATPPEEGVFL